MTSPLLLSIRLPVKIRKSACTRTHGQSHFHSTTYFTRSEMSDTQRNESPLANSSDSGIQGSDSTDEVLCSTTAVSKSPQEDPILSTEMVDAAEVFVIQSTSSSVIKKERHLSSSSKRSSLKEEPRKEYFCGIGRYRPKWMQVFVDARFFTFLLCLNCFIEGALVSGFTSVILSSIERRYQFSSTAAGAIASTFDVAVLVSVLFISYFGGKGHKPRWLGVSLLIQGLGAFVFALPQFVFGEYTAGAELTEQFESCGAGIDYSSDCEGSNNFALAFFIIGNLLIGVGAAPLFTIGTSYLDDIVRPKHVSIHLGFFYMVTVIGPALGYGLGGAFLSVYVDPWVETNLEPSDPGWVGAWWLCFIFSGVVSWLISIPYFMFPRLLPDSHLVQQERQLEMAQKYEGKYGDKEETDLKVKVKSFPYHLKQVLLTPSWIFITVAICSSIIVLAGMVSFAPKYLESQFGLTASSASLIAGAVAIPAGGAGVITGALIVYFSKSTGRRVALINWIIAIITIAPTFIFLLHCPTVELAGVTAPYSDGLTGARDTRFLNSSCVADCMCNSTIFEPVCGADGLNYFSPCRASCQKTVNIVDGVATTVFENCSCIATNLAAQMPNTSSMNVDYSQLTFDLLPNSTAMEGRCPQDCNLLGVFLAVIGVALFLIFMLQVPNVIITVRCVADEQRTLALGVQSLFFRAFGSIPGPIVFGVIFDSACIFWQYDCGRQGNCWVYNNTSLSERALALAIVGVLLNFIFSFLCWLVYPKQTQSEKEASQKLKDRESGASEKAEPVETTRDSESLESSDSYTVQGPQFPPKRRVSNRLESHCSEDILLDNVIEDDGIVLHDLHGSRAASVERHDTVGPQTVVQLPPM